MPIHRASIDSHSVVTDGRPGLPIGRAGNGPFSSASASVPARRQHGRRTSLTSPISAAQTARRFGARMRLDLAGRGAAIDLIEENATSGGIDCGFRRVPGYLCTPFFVTSLTRIAMS